MKTLFNIDLHDYEPSWKQSSRPSARAIIFPEISFAQINAQSPALLPTTKIALVYSRKFSYFKFPGGGIKSSEAQKEALCREVAEETGLVVDKTKIIEYGKVCRLQKSNILENTIFKQESFYYFADVKRKADGSLHLVTQKLDTYEKDEGFELQVVSIEEAINTNQILFKKEDADYFTNICVTRDTAVLQRLTEANCI